MAPLPPSAHSPWIIRHPWPIPALLLATSVGAMALVRGSPAWLPWAVVGVLLSAAFLWLMVSILWPGRVDRRCPECGAEGLVRADPRTTLGVVCRVCGQGDPHASSWTMAEEEDRGGDLEQVVLAQRGAGRGPESGPGSGVSDRPA